MEYQQIVAATERQFKDEERDIEARQAEVDSTQAMLDRRRKVLKRKRAGFGRKALKRKRSGFGRMLEGWQTLDTEVASGKPSRSDAADEDPDERQVPADTEAAA